MSTTSCCCRCSCLDCSWPCNQWCTCFSDCGSFPDLSGRPVSSFCGRCLDNSSSWCRDLANAVLGSQCVDLGCSEVSDCPLSHRRGTNLSGLLGSSTMALCGIQGVQTGFVQLSPRLQLSLPCLLVVPCKVCTSERQITGWRSRLLELKKSLSRGA